MAHFVAVRERAGETALRTEREARALERAGVAGRFSADVADPGHGQMRRWPDLVLDGPTGRVAIKLELSVKSAERLRRILAGYLLATWFAEVRLFFCAPHVGRALERAVLHARAHTPSVLFAGDAQPTLTLAPWPLLGRHEQLQLRTNLVNGAEGSSGTEGGDHGESHDERSGRIAVRDPLSVSGRGSSGWRSGSALRADTPRRSSEENGR